MRIMLDSFEEWYANQSTYYKVDGPPPGEKLKEYAMTLTDMAQLLGMTEASTEELLVKIDVERVVICGRRYILKSSFEEWYKSQRFYRTVADQEVDKQAYGDTITMPEIARLLGVQRNTVYGMVSAGRFETIKTARTTLVKRHSFDRWYQEQAKYPKVSNAYGGEVNGINR